VVVEGVGAGTEAVVGLGAGASTVAGVGAGADAVAGVGAEAGARTGVGQGVERTLFGAKSYPTPVSAVWTYTSSSIGAKKYHS
jgi:hypothetical protein